MWSKIGGRKFLVSLIGIGMLPALAWLKAPSDAFSALSVIVLSFCGGNAAVEWKHAGANRAD